MLIIGGKDYYDSARAYGEDPTLVFVRTNDNTVEKLVKLPIDGYIPFSIRTRGLYLAKGYRYKVHLGINRISDNLYWKRSGNEINVGDLTVILCGKLYRGLRFRGPNTDQIIWSYKSLVDYLDQRDWEIAPSHRGATVTDHSVRQYFEVQEIATPKLTELIDIGVVVAISDNIENYYRWGRTNDAEWRVNTDGLKALNFAKVLDPYQAYQELAMYVGGVLPRQPNPMIELQGEEIMTAKHGFHETYAFRKQPSETKGK